MCSQVGSLIGLFTKNPPNSVNVSLAKHCMNKLPFSVTKCVNAKRRKKKKFVGFQKDRKGSLSLKGTNAAFSSRK